MESTDIIETPELTYKQQLRIKEIDGLRKLLAMYEADATFSPVNRYMSQYYNTFDELHAATTRIQAQGHEIEFRENDNCVKHTATFGAFRVELNYYKFTNCERVEVGTEEVEEDVEIVPAVTEKRMVTKPIMGYVCK